MQSNTDLCLIKTINMTAEGTLLKNQACSNNRLLLVFSPAIEMLEIVECDLEKPSQIVPALGRASVVICCIGASEKEIFDVTGPYRIDFLATKNLVDAGKSAFELMIFGFGINCTCETFMCNLLLQI